jgi:hypothetical protein
MRKENVYTYTYINIQMLRTISVLIRCKDTYKIWLRRTILAPNTSASLQTTLAADAHLAEGEFFTWGADTEQNKVFDVPSKNSTTKNFPSKRTEFPTKKN